MPQLPEILASGRTRTVGLGIVGFLVLLQVDPCTEPQGGCGAPLVADGAQTCEEWEEARASEPPTSDFTIREVPVGRYVDALRASGVETPGAAALATAVGSPAPDDAVDDVAKMQAYVLAHAEQSDPEERIGVVLDLGDLPFPELSSLRTMDAATRSEILATRKERIEQDQVELTRHLHRLGARTAKPVGLLNHLQAWVPAQAMPEVAAHPDVEAIYPSWQALEPLYDQEQVRQATHLSEFWDLGIKGDSASNSCDPALGYEDMKIAIIEPRATFHIVPNMINAAHPGWADCELESCESRIRAEFDCTQPDSEEAACSPWTGEPINPCDGEPLEGSFHGTWVASIAAGDITQGQDPNTADRKARRRRTGIAPEASILYFTSYSPGELAAAMMQAFVLGVDVINVSMACVECSSNLYAECGGLNQVIRTVTQGGTLVVAAAGNEHEREPETRCTPSPGSTVCYPAFRPEVLAIGNVHTETGVDYGLAEIAADSSRGMARVRVAGRYGSLFPDGVDVPLLSIAAPGTLCDYFDGVDSYDPGDPEESGTSFAAPVVSAASVLIREELGAPVRDARMLKSHILAMGDGTGAREPAPGVAVGISDVWGAGRAKFHPFAAMQGPKAMAHRKFTIHESEQVSFHPADPGGEAFSPSTTQWKIGMYIDSPEIAEIPYLLISYWDVCNRPRLLASDLHPGIERHAIFESPAVDEACLEIRVYGYSVAEGGVDVFVTDYHHSGDPSEH